MQSSISTDCESNAANTGRGYIKTGVMVSNVADRANTRDVVATLV